jgi:hypothetical protein
VRVINPNQLPISTMGPTVGDRWRNNHTGTICTVLALAQRHYNWLTIRIGEREQIVPVANFLRTFTRI